MVSILLAMLLVNAGSAGGQLLEALAVANLDIEYSADGAADATVMDLGNDGFGVVRNPPTELLAVVNLRENAIPLLIEHLSDRHPTRIPYRVAEETGSTPLGFVALDILLHVVEGPVHVQECSDDGLGACVRPGYYFPPNSTAEEMQTVANRWRSLAESNQLQFVYPEPWKPAPN